jgi:translation initiation factor IF-3
MPLHEALRIAQEHSLDVVEVGASSTPPLVKILDYGKYQYQKERSQKGGKAPGQEVKTVQIGFRTEAHDLHVRSTQIDKFLAKGHRVKIEMKLRGREKGMVPLGRERFTQFLQIITEPYDIETPIKSFPGGIGMLVKPK